MKHIFEHLNGSDARLGACEDEHSADAPRRRVLGRLGEYAALAVAPLNMRPTGATLLYEDADRVEVRVSTPSAHVVLVLAPEGDLTGEVFWMRALSGRNLPVPRLIAHDMSCAVMPFTYVLQSYAAGFPLSRLENPVLMRIAARQIGRTLRKAHQIVAPGFGRPTPNGRWRTRVWVDVLADWLGRRGFSSRAEDALGQERASRLREATLEHPGLACAQPSLIHGAVEPGRALVTVGDIAQLEALSRPGEIVGGDPMFDLAHGLLSRHPEPFRQGLLEGYAASGPLDAAQVARLGRLRLLVEAADVLAGGGEAELARLPAQVDDALLALSS